MKVIINGAAGRMGQELIKLCNEGFADANAVALVDGFSPKFIKSLDDFIGEADVLVDFSNHLATKSVCDYAVKRNLPVVIATTGQTPEEIEIIKNASNQTAVFFSGNMSVGIAMLRKLVKSALSAFPTADVEIVETHHDRKLDAPSGTALMLLKSVQEVRPDAYPVFGREGNSKRTPSEVGVHSLRYGNIVGRHEVIISTDAETLTLTHQAHSRAVFAEGALTVASFMQGKPAGLYEMTDFLGA